MSCTTTAVAMGYLMFHFTFKRFSTFLCSVRSKALASPSSRLTSTTAINSASATASGAAEQILITAPKHHYNSKHNTAMELELHPRKNTQPRQSCNLSHICTPVLKNNKKRVTDKERAQCCQPSLPKEPEHSVAPNRLQSKEHYTLLGLWICYHLKQNHSDPTCTTSDRVATSYKPASL